MADPTTGSATDVTGGASGGQTGLDQALVGAIAAAVQTAVSQATSQMQAQLNSLSENIDKVAKADTTDSDSGYLVRSSVDPSASQRRHETYAELALGASVDFARAIQSEIVRKVSQDTDHHGALPPVAPRSASGPGTTAS